MPTVPEQKNLPHRNCKQHYQQQTFASIFMTHVQVEMPAGAQLATNP
jgi:hypothetical protein